MSKGCAIYNADWPLRARSEGRPDSMGKPKVVHAAKVRIHKEYTRFGRNLPAETVPQKEVIQVACSSSRYHYDSSGTLLLPMWHLLENNETITCKNCMKIIGMKPIRDDGNLRFVLMEKESGYFFKKDGKWQEDVGNASLYINKHSAEGHGNRRIYTGPSGKEIFYEEYRALNMEERGCCRVRWEFDHEKYEIKTVRITVE